METPAYPMKPLRTLDDGRVEVTIGNFFPTGSVLTMVVRTEDLEQWHARLCHWVYERSGSNKPIRRQIYGGQADITHHPDGWELRFDTSDQATVIHHITTTALTQLARDINRAVKETRQQTKEGGTR